MLRPFGANSATYKFDAHTSWGLQTKLGSDVVLFLLFRNPRAPNGQQDSHCHVSRRELIRRGLELLFQVPRQKHRAAGEGRMDDPEERMTAAATTL